MLQNESLKHAHAEINCRQPTLRVSSIQIQKFRLLHNVEIDLSSDTTVLVGRNNSGKTTLAEALTYFLDSQKPKFALADFSTESYRQFYQALELYCAGKREEAREALPEITLTLKISYDADIPEYGPLAAAIVDLDPECTEAILEFKYSLKGGSLNDLFAGMGDSTDSDTIPSIEDVMEIMAKRIPTLFDRTITAVDPHDSSNTRDLTIEVVRSLITVHFLTAQRGLDDEKKRPKDLIGKVFQTLFEAAMQASDGTMQKATADHLSAAVEDIERELGDKVSAMMTNLVPALEKFGYPGLNNPQMEAATKLDITKLLANYTSIRYSNSAGVSLPESYSGLGSRNLILILFTLLGYYREFEMRGATPGLHLVFIEEPEAHLHPQMQEVFIEQLTEIATLFRRLTEEINLGPRNLLFRRTHHISQVVRIFLRSDISEWQRFPANRQSNTLKSSI